MTRREGDNAGGESKQARVVCIVDDETEEYDEECGLGRGGWDGRWDSWVYYYCGGDDKVAISAAAMSCGREGTLRPTMARSKVPRIAPNHQSIASSRPLSLLRQSPSRRLLRAYLHLCMPITLPLALLLDLTLGTQANVSLCKKAPCPRTRTGTNTAMTASQWSHLDAALSFTRIQLPTTGASGLRYRSTRTSLLLRQPWSWPSAFLSTREIAAGVQCWSGKVSKWYPYP